MCAARRSLPGSNYELVSVSPSDSGHMLTTASADEARDTAICHAICINYIFEGEGNLTNSTNSTNPINSTNPSPGLPMEVHVYALCDISHICLDVFVTGCLPAKLQTV